MFTWPSVPQAKYYRLIVENAAGVEIFSAVILRETRSYRAPSWLLKEATTELLRWRVVALDANQIPLSETPRRTLRRVGP